MSSKDRVGQLKDQLQDAKEKGDDDKVLQIETELFQMRDKKADGGFPDLTGDGKVTRKDVLKGRGVKLASGGEAVLDATTDINPNGGISRGGGAALRGTKFIGIR
jgi:hypothetical protein|tara:strand:- start:1345 stop:1659 length:315 start_codon:yes stop_codon:yes gene_type:complete